MTRQAIETTEAPAALGPYSQAIVAGGFVFCSGTAGIDPATGVAPDGIEAQTEQALTNLAAVLEAAGSSRLGPRSYAASTRRLRVWSPRRTVDDFGPGSIRGSDGVGAIMGASCSLGRCAAARGRGVQTASPAACRCCMPATWLAASSPRPVTAPLTVVDAKAVRSPELDDTYLVAIRFGGRPGEEPGCGRAPRWTSATTPSGRWTSARWR